MRTGRADTKKNAEIAVETDAEVDRAVTAALRGKGLDFEAVESAVRCAVLAAGAGVIEKLLKDVGCGRRQEKVRCRCGAKMESRGLRSTSILCLLGWIRFERSLYVCPQCGHTRYPGDEVLDLVNSRSPGIRRQVVRLGAKETFKEVSTDLLELADIKLCRKEAERIAEYEGEQMEAWMAKQRETLRLKEPPSSDPAKTIEILYVEPDGTGIPMVESETEGRKGKQADGSAKTREAKVACVFTQTACDDNGHPIRDPKSTSFVAAIETAEVFGWRVFAEAVRRGLYQAKHVIALGDGAEWVKKLIQIHFPMAEFIIDYYHAVEHVGALCNALFDRDLKRSALYRERWIDHLWQGNIDVLLEQSTALLPSNPDSNPDARTQYRYFEKNKDHMRYAAYRERGLFIGSGVVEGACKNLVGARLKQSGMEWTVRGANAILAARSVILSNRMEEYWEDRAA